MDAISIKDSLSYNGIYRGVVVDNMDPDFYGRTKVRVFPLFTNMNVAGIPWATPAMGIFSGAGSNFGNLAIPEVGSFVFVFFENGDPYQPVYFAEAQTAYRGLPSARKSNTTPEDYPFIKVNRTKNGVQIKINDHYDPDADPEIDNRDIRIDHPSGSWVEFYPDGRVTVHTASPTGTILIEADEADINVLAKKGDVSVSAEEGNISATADLGDVTTKALAGTNKVEATAGDVILQAGGNVLVIGTGISVTGSGNMVVDCTGDVVISGQTVSINPP